MKTQPAYFGHKVDPERDGIVYLCLDRYIRMDAARDLLLSFDLRTEADIDRAIGQLQNQLALAGKAAKLAIQRGGARTKAKRD